LLKSISFKLIFANIFKKKLKKQKLLKIINKSFIKNIIFTILKKKIY